MDPKRWRVRFCVIFDNITKKKKNNNFDQLYHTNTSMCGIEPLRLLNSFQNVKM